MKIEACMKQPVITIPNTATVADAASSFATHRVGTLPVLEPSGRMVGVIHLRDLLALVMPAFVQLVEGFDYVGDFGVLESQRPSPAAMAQPVTAVMQPPIAVEASCGLLRAFALMRKYELRDVPVVDATGRLVGIASRVDIGAALLASWQSDIPPSPPQ